jgi:predicted nucleic acid-binding protein
VFLDTNVFVYAHDDADEHKTRQAQELIAGLAMEEDIAISSQVVQEFCSVVLNKIGLAVSELQCIVNDEFAKTMAHTPDIAFYQRALDLQQRYRLSFYDSLIVQAALDLGCRTLYSEDLQAGARYGTLTVINPFEA